MGMHARTKILLGESGIDKLSQKKVIIFGVGGVGGYVAEMLARTGVGSITLVDFDVVSLSNLNRQIIALNSTIGVEKVLIMKNRIKDINPEIKADAVVKKLTPENIEDFNLSLFDYVVDCIDMVKSKIALIKHCFDNNINIVCSMGTANRNHIPYFDIYDLFSTKNDGLARVLRRELKKIGVDKLNVVCSSNLPISSQELGSLVYFPASCACCLSAFVIDELLKTSKN